MGRPPYVHQREDAQRHAAAKQNPPMKTLYSALLQAQHAMPKLPLDSTNPHFGSRFVSLPKLLDSVRPVLNNCGLVLAQHPTTLDGAPALRTQIIHGETGEFIEDIMPLLLSKQDAQGQGSALTYARRYAILALLGLAGDEDDDGQAASTTREARREQPPARRAPDAVDAVERAQQAQAAAAPAPPVDEGDPGQVQVHFGKNKGKRLADLSQRSVKWYAETWEPNPQYETPQDRRLRVAAQMLTGLPAPTPHAETLDEIPFE